MRIKRISLRTVIIGMALIAGIFVGTIGFGPVIANNLTNQNQVPVQIYPVNENGQTYGKAPNATSPDTVPDLIEAVGVDGTIGYVRSVDLNGPTPKTPEEAVALTKKNMAAGVRQILLFEVDGKTVIGTFEVGGGEFKMIPAENIK